MAAILYDLPLVLDDVLLLPVLLALYLFSEMTQWPHTVECKSIARAYYAVSVRALECVLKKDI